MEHPSMSLTDLDVHAMWLCRECEHYFVALEETKVHLVAMGVLPPEVAPHRPQPFPGSRSPRYVPDPF